MDLLFVGNAMAMSIYLYIVWQNIDPAKSLFVINICMSNIYLVIYSCRIIDKGYVQDCPKMYEMQKPCDDLNFKTFS